MERVEQRTEGGDSGQGDADHDLASYLQQAEPGT